MKTLEEAIRTMISEQAPQMGSGNSKVSDAAERAAGAAERAAKAFDKGDKKKALKELTSAEKFLATMKRGIGKA